MQVAANDGLIDHFLRAANLICPTRADIQRYIALHLTAIAAFDSRRGFAVRIIVNQRSVAADIHSGTVFSITAGAITHDTAGVQMIAALHLQTAGDLQISITLNGALIRAADYIM